MKILVIGGSGFLGSHLCDELIEAGATEVTLAVNGPGYDLTDVKEWIAWRDSKN